MGWEIFSYYLFSRKQLLLNIMSPTTKKEAWFIMSLFGYWVFCLDQFTKDSKAVSLVMEPRIRYDSLMDLPQNIQ